VRRWGFLSLGLIALLIAAVPAQAQFPGSNGKIYFNANAGNGLWIIEPDGTGLTAAPSGGGSPAASPADDDFAFIDGLCEFDTCALWLATHARGQLAACETAGGLEPDNPAWSPDARLIAYDSDRQFESCEDTPDFQTWIMLHDMTTDTAGPLVVRGHDPDWSPDGTRIAYEEYGYNPCCGVHTGGVWTVAPDGTGATRLVDGYDPSWSPDGSRLLISAWDGTDLEIHVINRDGTGRVPLTANTTDDYDAIWSPDGTKIVYVNRSGPAWDQQRLHTMNADGSGQAEIPMGLPNGTDPSWDSIPVNGYPRPKAATPIYIPLVPAYAACSSANRQHAPPLSHGACNPPASMSPTLGSGTSDANGAPANLTGFMRLRVSVDDVALSASVTDVRCKAIITACAGSNFVSGPDYTGELRLQATVRATDKLNSPAPTPSGQGAGTVQDAVFGPSIPCSPTADTNIGSACSISTTVNALIPGLVVAGARSNWEFGQVQVDDGGPDGDGDTAGDNTPFLAQGIFVP
jgi:hypothetical protein